MQPPFEGIKGARVVSIAARPGPIRGRSTGYSWSLWNAWRQVEGGRGARGGMEPGMIAVRELDIRIVSNSVENCDHRLRSGAQVLKSRTAEVLGGGSGYPRRG